MRSLWFSFSACLVVWVTTSARANHCNMVYCQFNTPSLYSTGRTIMKSLKNLLVSSSFLQSRIKWWLKRNFHHFIIFNFVILLYIYIFFAQSTNFMSSSVSLVTTPLLRSWKRQVTWLWALLPYNCGHALGTFLKPQLSSVYMEHRF